MAYLQSWDDDAKKYLNQMIEYSVVNKELVILWECETFRGFEMTNYEIHIQLDQSDEAVQLVREQSYGMCWYIADARQLKIFPIKNGDILQIYPTMKYLYEECEILLELVRKTHIRKVHMRLYGVVDNSEKEYIEMLCKNIANSGKTQVECYMAENNTKIIESD